MWMERKTKEGNKCSGNNKDFQLYDDKWLINQFRFPRATLLDLRAELGPADQTDGTAPSQYKYK